MCLATQATQPVTCMAGWAIIYYAAKIWLSEAVQDQVTMYICCSTEISFIQSQAGQKIQECATCHNPLSLSVNTFLTSISRQFCADVEAVLLMKGEL